MIKKIELRNFQSHKHTVIDFSEGINVLCGESDNGKTAIIRAIRWVYENRPLGTDKLNSNWNKKFKEPMSVKLTLDNNIWVERMRDGSFNGYKYSDGESEISLDAVGSDVPQKIKDLLNFTDVNFQFQLDSPYLLSMSAPEASRYLNQIIHLDSIDKMLSTADSNKRNLNSDKKHFETDVKDFTAKVESLSWLDEANGIQTRIDKYDGLIANLDEQRNDLADDCLSYRRHKSEVIDLSEQEKIVSEIEEIVIPDDSEIKYQIESYKKCRESVFDVSEQESIIKDIEAINVPDRSSLQNEISEYKNLLAEIKDFDDEQEKLLAILPEVCPLCGSKLVGGNCVQQ